jgi:hypothetical protein
METKTVTVYSYQELSDKAKEKVYNDSLEMFNIDSNDRIEETIKETLDKEGLSGLKNDIRFSISNSQGDGVAFFGDVNLEEFMKAQEYEAKTPIPDFVNVDIYSNSNHYCHYNTMSIENDLDSIEVDKKDDFDNYIISQATYDETKRLIDYVLEKCKDISRELEHEAYKIIKHEYSLENLIEMCDVNEWQFYANGEMFVSDETLKAIMEYTEKKKK